ncbi:MAG TPA: KEOPS complex subunit Pcc1 [Methanocorpusculum sp.]|nr:KEOPS complex subunit Pcc1 [Methanocorpusculum sp.]
MKHCAVFTFETPDAGKLYEVLSPEAGQDPGDKACTQLSVNGDVLTFRVDSDDCAGLRASLNMWLRLIDVSEKIMRI